MILWAYGLASHGKRYAGFESAIELLQPVLKKPQQKDSRRNSSPIPAELLDALPEEKYLAARTYIQNLSKNLL